MRRTVCLLLLLVFGCGGTAPTPGTEEKSTTLSGDAADSTIVMQRLALARQERWDTLPIGTAVALAGRTFVGAPYQPGTLEAPGPERLVINLRTFDCVTFVENSLALARVIRQPQPHTYARFKQELQRIRYRGGVLAGYPSRLHYFSEWIDDNEARGIVTNLTRELGGERDPRPINFMTTHVGSYRQLSEPGVLEQIRQREVELSRRERFVIPESRIASVAARIRDGDVIAAASTLPGLDVAHTGLALWVNGQLHLMHAPLVGSHVEISTLPLAERIVAQEKQNGIMVARPR